MAWKLKARNKMTAAAPGHILACDFVQTHGWILDAARLRLRFLRLFASSRPSTRPARYVLILIRALREKLKRGGPLTLTRTSWY